MATKMQQTIVISAINFRNGGPLSILEDCLLYANNHLSSKYRIIALVHKIELFKNLEHIELIEFPKSTKSYLYRLYYEYIHFKKISLNYTPYLWLSLHDMTPNVQSKIRAVYCHNPSPFYQISLHELWLDPKFALFNFFYKYLYAINISQNQYVVVQQDWLRDKFKSIYNINNVIVAHPEIKHCTSEQETISNKVTEKTHHFFFPTLPRIFKNIEIICEAVKILSKENFPAFKVTLTIDGTENRYARSLLDRYKNLKNIHFIGKQARDKVFEIYENTDCLIFPSKLETWGMPITEFQNYNKPILLADLGYAHETAGNYQKIKFFNPLDPYDLADKMKQSILNTLIFDHSKNTPISAPYAENWDELFSILLSDNHDI